MTNRVRSYSMAAGLCFIWMLAQTARADAPCRAIWPKPGNTPTLLRGKAPTDGLPLCYVLHARKGRTVTLNMDRGGEEVVFKIAEPPFDEADDELRHSSFVSTQAAYQIVVFAETHRSAAEPFTLSVSLK